MPTTETHRTSDPAGDPQPPWMEGRLLLLAAALGAPLLGTCLVARGALQANYIVITDRPPTAVVFLTILLAFGPLVGWLADRYPRKWVAALADLAHLFVVYACARLAAGIPGFTPAEAALLTIGFAVIGVVLAPARLAIIPAVLPADQWPRALAGMVGLTAAVFVYTAGLYVLLFDPARHPAAWLWPGAVLCALGAAALIPVCPFKAGRPAQRARPNRSAALTGGVKYLLERRRSRELVAMAVAFGVGVAVFLALLSAAAQGNGQPSDSLGLFVGLAIVGIIVGSLVISRLTFALRSETALTWSLLGVAAAGTLVIITFQSETHRFPPASGLRTATWAPCCLLFGLFAWGFIAHCTVLWLRVVARRFHGRVLGLFELLAKACLLVVGGGLMLGAGAPDPRWRLAIALAAGILLLAVAALSLGVRLRRAPFDPALEFIRNLNDFLCRWRFGLRRVGRCTIPATGPVIVAANHTCSIDPCLVIAASPRRIIGYLVAREYTRYPITGWMIRKVECIPVSRSGEDTASVRAALRHLDEGKVLGIFPEGTIPAPGETLDPKTGVALLALRSAAVVVPAHISGTRWSSSLLLPFFRRHRARVRFGPPVDLSAYRQRPRSRRTLAEVAELIMTSIQNLAAQQPRHHGGP